MSLSNRLSELSVETLLGSLSIAALVIDEDGRLVYANPAFERLVDCSVADVAGRRVTDFIIPVPKVDCRFCHRADPSNAESSAASGGHLSDSLFPVSHGGFLYVKALNDAGIVLESLDEAKSGIGQPLSLKIKHSALGKGFWLCLLEPFSQDASLNQAHNDFVSTVSHEFRTPLTSIKGFADTLLHYGAQLPEAEKQRFISIIKDQAERLIRLVENLLTVSTMGAEGDNRVDLRYRPIPVRRMLDKVVQGIQAKLRAKSSRERAFDIQVNPSALEVWADADRLEQILINLIDNAVKYSPSESLVHIQAGFFPDDDTRIRLVIRDEGVGIPEAMLPRIFTKFYRVESPLRQDVEGTGLGLYIAQSLTQAMGGRILASSQPNQGSAFTVILPAATPERQALYQRRMASSDA